MTNEFGQKMESRRFLNFGQETVFFAMIKLLKKIDSVVQRELDFENWV